MSVEAITWALNLKVERSSAKFVLVAMANCANNDMTCWPSVQYLSDATCQDRKTVLENIKRLKDAGLIMDTQLRKGHTGQVIVYQLKNTENGSVKESQKRDSTENGTVPKTNGNSPVFPVEQSRFSVETDPKTGHGTINESSIESSGNQKQSGQAAELKFDPMAALLEAGVDAQVAGDWIQLRKKKRADVSLTVLREHIKQAGIAGLTLNDALRMSCLRGWQGFDASFVKPQVRTNNTPNDLASINARNNAEAKRLLGITDDDMRTIDA